MAEVRPPWIIASAVIVLEPLPRDSAVVNLQTSWGLSSSKGFTMKLSCCKSELTSSDTYQPLSLWENIQSLPWEEFGTPGQLNPVWFLSADLRTVQNLCLSEPSLSKWPWVCLTTAGATWSHVGEVRGGTHIFLTHSCVTKIAVVSFPGGPLASWGIGFGDGFLLSHVHARQSSRVSTARSSKSSWNYPLYLSTGWFPVNLTHTRVIWEEGT